MITRQDSDHLPRQSQLPKAILARSAAASAFRGAQIVPIMPLVVAGLILLGVSMTSSARADCLDNAADFAERLCAKVRTIGKSALVTESGDLNAAAKELITTSVGELSGNVSAVTKPYEDVLQEQLGTGRVSLRKCGIAMAKTAIDQTCFTGR